MKRLILIILLVLTSCKTAKKKLVAIGTVSEHAMVVTARKEASKVGLEILKNGGNAFDAMIATEFALAVAYPFAGSLGGGGFMVYRTNEGNIGSLDYREKAPLAATKNMFLDEKGNIIPKKSTLGAMAVGVPGNVAGMFAVHERFGTLSMQDILNPVINLAYKGIVVTEKQKERLKKYRPLMDEANQDRTMFEYDWQLSDTIKRSSLAATLEKIMLNGKEEFYQGETAKKLVNYIQENGGIMTLEDLKRYEVKWREPFVFEYDDLTIISMSPPSSGGICLGQIMKMVEPFDLHKLEHNSTTYIQILAEAQRRAYADRSYYLGDPDFVSIPSKELISEAYLSNRMKSFSTEKATSSSNITYGNIEFKESDETTHYSIVDQFGNAISATTTLNGAYGSKLFCSELGFFLNNQMDDFSSKPGEPNMFGLIGAEANSIAPEKRMLSSMTPTIVEKNNKLYMNLGTPGGSTIITCVLQAILNVHEFNMGMQEAIDEERFHHQWLPDEIRMEPDLFKESVKTDLTEKGYIINEERSPVIGKVNGILILNDGKLEGGADKRGDDTALGM